MGCPARAILVSISYRSTLNVLLYAGGSTSTLMVLLLVTRTLTELGTFGCWVASTETHKKYNNTEMVKQDLQDDILALLVDYSVGVWVTCPGDYCMAARGPRRDCVALALAL